MDFDGKEVVVEKVRENAQRETEFSYLTQKVEKLTQLVERAYGANIHPQSDKTPNGKNLLDSLTKDTSPAAYRLKAIRKSI
jgi:hypothetical protein